MKETMPGSSFEFKHLPQRPAPEVDVIVVKVLEVNATTRLADRCEKSFQQRRAFVSLIAIADPAPFALAVVLIRVELLAVVRGIAEAHEDPRLPLHLLGLARAHS